MVPNGQVGPLEARPLWDVLTLEDAVRVLEVYYSYPNV